MKRIDDEILREVDALAPEAPLARDDVRYLPADLLAKRSADVELKKMELATLVDRRFWILDAAYGWRLVQFLTVAAGVVMPFAIREPIVTVCKVGVVMFLVSFAFGARFSWKKRQADLLTPRIKELESDIERWTTGRIG